MEHCETEITKENRCCKFTPQKRSSSIDQCADYDYFSAGKKLKTLTITSQFETNSQKFIKNLLAKVINDSSCQKSIFLNKLTRRIHELGIEPVHVVDCTLSWLLMQPKVLEKDAGFLLKVMSKALQLINRNAERVQALVPKVLVVTQPFLEKDNSSRCCVTREIICNLSKIAGKDSILAVIRLQMNDNSEYVRDLAIKSMGIVASTLGIDAVLPFIESCCQRIEPPRVRCAAIKMVEQIALHTGCDTLRWQLRPLIQIISFGLVHKDLEIVRLTALALAALAKAASPYGFEEFRPVMDCNFGLCFLNGGGGGVGFIHRRGSILGALMKLFTRVIQLTDFTCTPFGQLTDSDTTTINWYMVNGVLLLGKIFREINDGDYTISTQEMKEMAVEAIKALAEMKNIELHDFLKCDRRGFIGTMWGRSTAILSKDKYVLIVETTIALANKLGIQYIKRSVSQELSECSEEYRRMVLEIVEKIEKIMACQDASSDSRDVRLNDIFQDMACLFSACV